MTREEVQLWRDQVETESAETMRVLEREWQQLVDAITRKLAYPQIGPRAEVARYWQDK